MTKGRANGISETALFSVVIVVVDARPLGGAVAPRFGRSRVPDTNGSFTGVLQNPVRSFSVASLLRVTLAVAGFGREGLEKRAMCFHLCLTAPLVCFCHLTSGTGDFSVHFCSSFHP